MSPAPVVTPAWHLYVPKLYTVLRRGYRRRRPALRRDRGADGRGRRFATGHGARHRFGGGPGEGTPDRDRRRPADIGLWAAHGCRSADRPRHSCLWSSASFERFGYEALLLCTLLAGLMLIAAGLLRIGTLMKYMPQPVITGFTAGIAVSIFLSQVKDLLGLRMGVVPAEFFARLGSLRASSRRFQPGRGCRGARQRRPDLPRCAAGGRRGLDF